MIYTLVKTISLEQIWHYKKRQAPSRCLSFLSISSAEDTALDTIENFP